MALRHPELLRALPVLAAGLLAACATVPPVKPDLDALRAQVTASERAFAKSMADRDHAAFVSHLSQDAVFYGGPEPLKGKAAVAAGWKAYFDGPKAPFSWAPDHVDVLADGTLAWSTGPVFGADGKRILRFNSVWRQEAPGVWRIVFDKGQPMTEADRQAGP